MKIKLLSTLVLLSFQISFSQTIKGKIVFNNYAISKVDIINASTKDISISDANGYFSIDAKMNDTLVFIAKNYDIKKIIVNPLITNDKNLIIELTLKAEELKEVVITKIPSIKLNSGSKYAVDKLDEYGLEKSAYTPKVIGVNMGTIENGIDFIRIGGMIAGLFKKEKETVKKEKPIIPFKDLARTSCDQNYFFETLKLKPDEIELFLEFCDVDSNSKNIATSNNILVTMDFLFKKNLEFKKLHTPE
ncbi:hypothetical protein ABS764_10420 [Flavobacterium sp. ST-87]|uniref:CarboxypepD_reg-like domain-containing protein n=1 Tax=Flavobacterium plantiphilum TaxID=3163297 RepID=A0ABW8XVI3_9FLAO